ncbi:hypothetical protein WNY59_11240 [Ahrensia kielensis]|uniref:Uncharacterized protein n=1 Tax=Ahrensia kielensis TaxID=76980 RepID=A0ABU9T7R5_9HYPH
MNTLYKTLFAASALTTASAIPASADYSLMEDTSLPSVIFVEFSGDAAEPVVIKAPSNSASIMDPALPVVTSEPTRSQGNTQATLGGPAKKSKSVDERVEDAIADLEKKSDKDFEDEIIKDAVEEKIFEGAALR